MHQTIRPNAYMRGFLIYYYACNTSSLLHRLIERTLYIESYYGVLYMLYILSNIAIISIFTFLYV